MQGRRITRRRFLQGTAALAFVPAVPLFGRTGAAFATAAADPATAQRNRLVVIFLDGGNDGLNTVIPRADVDGTKRYSVYSKVRPKLRYRPDEVLALDRPSDAPHALGLHPALTRVHGMYKQGRVAIVQGVHFPGYTFSHFTDSDTVHSGLPEAFPDSGWLGRHLDRAGVGVGELRGVAIHYELPLMLQGRERQGLNIPSIPLQFADGTKAFADARHDALEQFAAHPSDEPLRQYAGQLRDSTVDLVESLERVTRPPTAASRLADALLTARVLLEGSFGLECVFITVGGFDTHAAQRTLHQALLADLDLAIGTFFDGNAARGIVPMAPAVASRTIVMTVSEFGRRLRENSDGTDHGAANAVFLVGPAGGRLVPGLHGEHPNLGTTLLPADNLDGTTDLRAVYQSVLQGWLSDPDPAYGEPLAGLFV